MNRAGAIIEVLPGPDSFTDHKKKCDKLMINCEICYSHTGKDDRTFYKTDIFTDEIVCV